MLYRYMGFVHHLNPATAPLMEVRTLYKVYKQELLLQAPSS